jgi:hypothetical protein
MANMKDNVPASLEVAKVCVICSESFSPGHPPVAIRSCGHTFDYRCHVKTLYGTEIETDEAWCHDPGIYRGSAKCPTCSQLISSDQAEGRVEAILADISHSQLVPDHQEKLNTSVEQLLEGVARVDVSIECANTMRF